MAPTLTDPVTDRALEIVRDGPYAGADVINARRFSVAVHVSTVAVMALLALVWPPTRLGEAGWALPPLLALTVALKLLVLRRTEGARVFDVLLASAYLVVAQIGMTQWLAGGWATPYSQIFLAYVLVVALTHPRQRAMPFAIVVVLLALSPMAYGETHGRTTDIGIAAILWLAATAFCTQIMAQLRAQRSLLMAVRDAAEDDARRDQLTGLGNRRSFEQALVEALVRARAVGRPLTLAVGDVDRFKGVDDRHGHLEGDRCLQAVAAALAGATRAGDRVFRWGGDEFVVLMEGTVAGGEGTMACRRFEAAVAGQVRTPAGEPMTVTFGWAQDDGSGTAEALLARADAALLDRKRARPARAA